MREWDSEDHLEAALEAAESDLVRHHIREALQQNAEARGEVDRDA